MKGFIEIIAMFAAIIAGTLLLTSTISITAPANDITQIAQLFESYEINLEKAAFTCNWENETELDNCIQTNSALILLKLNNNNIYNCVANRTLIDIASTNRKVIMNLDCNTIIKRTPLKKLQVTKDITLSKNRVFDELVLFVKMNNDMNDYSGNAITPILHTGTKINGIEGITNSAMSYVGANSYTKYAASNKLNTQTQITISAWIYPLGTGVEPIVEYSNGSSFGVHFWQFDTGTKLYANLIDTANGEHALMTSSNTIIPNTWQHVALTYNGTVAKLYVNGIEKTTLNYSEANLQTSYDFYIAKRPTDTVNTPNLKIDELMIWNRGLSATDINYIYQSQLKKV